MSTGRGGDEPIVGIFILRSCVVRVGSCELVMLMLVCDILVRREQWVLVLVACFISRIDSKPRLLSIRLWYILMVNDMLVSRWFRLGTLALFCTVHNLSPSYHYQWATQPVRYPPEE